MYSLNKDRVDVFSSTTGHKSRACGSVRKRSVINVVHMVEALEIGGLERVVDTIATGLDKNRFHPSVWCLVRGGRIFDELKNKGIDVQILNMRSHRDVLFFANLCRKLRRERIHVLHTHGCTATTMGRLAGIFARTPVVLSHMHTTYWDCTLRQLFIEKFLSCFSDRILCCSQAVADLAGDREKIRADKLEVIYNGVDIDKFERNSQRRIADEKEIVIGCVASFAPHKGHKYLLDAAKSVIDTCSDKVKFVLVGEGALKGELEEQAERLGISSYIIFRETVTDISEIMSSVDIAVLPSSEREGLGLAIIEAMAAGKPVIATSLGGLPEVVEHGKNGLLVPPKDTASLAGAMLYMLNHREEAIQMGVEGRAIVKKKFSVQGMLEKIENLYQGLLKRNNGAAEI